MIFPPFEASFAQVGMWITERMGRAGSAYHMPLVIRFDGPLDATALLLACEAVIRRHPVLSSAIAENDGLPVEVAGARPEVRIRVTEDLTELIRAETLRPFDVERGPLARFTLARLAPERYALIVVAHHLVFDGESKDVLVRDLAAFYNGRTLPRLATAYHQFAADERTRVTADLAEARAYWGPRWREPGETRLPGLPGGRRGAAPARAHTFLAHPPEVPGVSRFELFLAAVHTLLYMYGNATPCCAIDLSTRTPAVRDNIGLFVNELPISSRPSPELTVAGLARRLHTELREMYRFRAVPLARAVRGVRPRTALAAVSVSYRKRREEPEFTGLATTVDWAAFNHSVRSVLHFQAVDTPDGLLVIMQYGSDSGSPEVPPEVARTAEDLLVIMNNPDMSVSADLSAAAPDLAGAIREIWQEVLGIDEIGDDEDLFDLGGHSLTITQIIARMRKRLGVEVSLDVFFDTPTITGVVAAVLDAEPAVSGT
ncbi:condensation domain-containing protein [Acrocarpospora catenulata]|uniref:condensation domain-containing protein n=1 Tax=Acrocarpospora catenulata TaxID=2836182 RepID=UPI001BD94813|nr:condensation domain-containing protein [Acrocarpospora catenulata]